MTLSVAEATARLTAPGQMFEMVEGESAGHRVRIWKNAPPTLRTILELSRSHGDATFLVYEDERTTFEQHFRSAAQLAHALIERHGVRRGDRVAIAMRNYPEWVVSFWAAAAAGAVVVPLNAWWTGPELAFGLSDSGTAVLFADDERLERLEPHLNEIPLRGVVLARGSAHRAGTDRIEDLLAAPAQDAALPDVPLGPDDDATIFYTSGTTGRPKGAVGTHLNICTNLMSLFFVAQRSALQASAQERDGAAPNRPESRQNCFLLSVPLFHATGCHSILVTNTAAGGKLVMMYRWNPERALELIERERVTNFGGVPSMVREVLDSPDFSRRDTSSVTGIGYGGTPAPPDLVRRIKAHFPIGQPSNGYGLTETSSVTTMNSGDDYVRKPDSVGPPVPVVDVKVVSPGDEAELPSGEAGELCIRGPNVVRGYWNRPDATAEVFVDGWFHTGDIARIDDEGFVYIVDRAKDMVIRGGENVYCVEVEAALFEHPDVTDAAVIGVPHEILGEEVGAIVTVRAGSGVTVDDLRRHVAGRLAAFKVPSHIWLRDAPLPRNPAGKVLKRELREQLTGE
jgi:long-chain acyl-CoA synthetase